MLQIRKSKERGQVQQGWLNSYHTFSFGGYYDPKHMGFRVLRVINEDRVLPSNGFGTHPHSNMEIISYVISGMLEHKDSMGNGSVIHPGEFQIISAGTGITHSEFNPSSDEETHFYQIWILPDAEGLTPRYEQKSFAASSVSPKLQLVASKAGDSGALTVAQDIRLFKGVFSASEEVVLPLGDKRYGWLQVVKGHLQIAGSELRMGDGASISDVSNPELKFLEDGEFLFFDLP